MNKWPNIPGGEELYQAYHQQPYEGYGLNYPYVGSTDEAVDLAREKNAPVRVWVADYYSDVTAWKVYPSGVVRDVRVTE